MKQLESNMALKFEYFSIPEYIDKIKLCTSIEEHALFSEMEYMNYIEKLSGLDEREIDLFLTSTFYDELRKSNLIEENIIYPEEVIKGDVYIKGFDISHEEIKKIHNFATRGTCPYEYRTSDVWVSKIQNLEEFIFWYGAKPEDIKKFMDDFIELYKNDTFNSNIFLKSALLHLIFLRIHPFKDGNGRTARLISNNKLTEMSNLLCDSSFKISPLHLSHSIYFNKITYANIIDNIYFDHENFSNEAINAWFKFMLHMYDEQIFFMSNELNITEKHLRRAVRLEEKGIDKIELAKHIRIK